MYYYYFIATFTNYYSLENFALRGFCQTTCDLVTMAFFLVITDLKDYRILQILKQQNILEDFIFNSCLLPKSCIDVMFGKWTKFSSAEPQPSRMWIRKVETNRPCVPEMICYIQMHLKIKYTESGSVMWSVHLAGK